MKLGGLIRQRRESLSLTQDQVAARAGISKPYLSNIETGKAKNPPTDGVLERIERALGFESVELRRLAHLVRTPMDVRAAKDSAEAELEKLKVILRNLMSSGPRTGARGIDLDAALEQIDLNPPKSDGVGDVYSAGRPVPVINKVSAGYPHNFTDLDYPPRVAEQYVLCPEIDDVNAFAAHVVGDSMEPRYQEGDIVIFAPNTPAANGDDCFVRFEETHDTTFKRFYLDDDGLLRLQPLNSKYPATRYPREAINGLYPAVFRMQKLK